jgi:DNA modification methylase
MIQTKLLKIDEVKLNPNNPRTIKDEKFYKLVKSIQEFPKMLELRPIVVNDDMIVLGGNMRLKACKEAGLKEIPVIKASDLTDEQQKQFIIKDNVGFGDWDWEALKMEWNLDELNDWGLDIPEFVYEQPEAYEDGYEIPNEIHTDIVEGDIIEIGPHKLICGSSLEVDTWGKIMEDKMADMVLTDPPYNVSYVGKTKDALTIQNDRMTSENFYQFLYDFYTATGAYVKEGRGWYVWYSEAEGINFRNAMSNAGILLKQTLIWVKNVMVMGRQDYHNKHEPCLYGWKPGEAHYFIDDRTKVTVYEDEADYRKMSKKELIDLIKDMNSDTVAVDILRADKPIRNDLHPTMKPIKLMAQLIQNSSKEGELVVDAFLGSGSTMLAADQIGRICYGVELDPKYCQVIIDRMKKYKPELDIYVNGNVYEPA